MRSEQALKNMISNLILQITVFLSGIILPRFFLEAYGSSINGMVTSANQFLTYLSLAEAGVGTASIVALYVPLAEKNTDEINSVLAAAKRYYYKSGYLFLGLVLGLVWLYPYLIAQQLSPHLVRGTLLVLAGNTVIDFFFMGKYRILLTADQKSYISAFVEALGTVLNMFFTVGLIYLHVNVVIVKSVGVLIFIVRYLIVKNYVKKNYLYVDFKVKPHLSALKQKGAALIHQIVGIIVNNTDVVLLTILLGKTSLLEVSVYGIYYMVVSAINMLLNSFSNGLTAGFGEVISKQENDTLKSSFQSFEYLYYIVLFIVSVCMGVLLLPFIDIYTMNMTDTNYFRPLIAMLFTVIIFLQNVRIPSMTIVSAAGHFKETQGQAIMEAAINLLVSLLLIKPLGMAGVLIGTICSYFYRSTRIIYYTGHELVKGTFRKTIFRILRNFVVSALLVWGGINIVPQNMYKFSVWFIHACLTGGVSMVVLLAVNYFAEPSSFNELILRLRNILKRKAK